MFSFRTLIYVISNSQLSAMYWYWKLYSVLKYFVCISFALVVSTNSLNSRAMFEEALFDVPELEMNRHLLWCVKAIVDLSFVHEKQRAKIKCSRNRKNATENRSQQIFPLLLFSFLCRIFAIHCNISMIFLPNVFSFYLNLLFLKRFFLSFRMQM